MRAGKVVALVAGILIVIISLALLVPGGVLLGLYGTQRDADGFFKTSSRTLTSSGYALVTPNVELDLGPVAGMHFLSGNAARVLIVAQSTTGGSMFVGIGPTSKVTEYLAGVDYDEVTGFGWWMQDVRYRHVDGQTAPAPPEQQDFWVAKEEGVDTAVVDWPIEAGNWTAVVMNTNASAPVSANISLGARLDILFPIGLGMVIGGVVLLAVGILLIVLGARRPPAPPYVQGQMPYAPVAPAAPGAPYAPQPPAEPQPPAGSGSPPSS
jgi:hypothetical protein